MADPDDPAEAAVRLERALERIALLAARLPAAAEVQAVGAPLAETQPVDAQLAVDAAELASRLDALIGRLRSALDKTSGA